MISTGVLALRDKYKLIKYLVTGASALLKRGIPFDHSLLHPERPEVSIKTIRFIKFIFFYYVLYLLERKIFPCQSFLRKNNKIFVITFLFFPLCSLLFPVCV